MVHSLVTRKTDEPYPNGPVELEINHDKKVDMSLAAEDERFLPKVRSY